MNQLAVTEYFFNNPDNNVKKRRILVKRGNEFISFSLEDVAFFVTENKVVFLVDLEGNKFIVEKNNLMDLESDLNPSSFYRANRKYIVHILAIKSFRTIEGKRISLNLIIPTKEEIIVSQDNATDFKNWIQSL